MMMPNGSSQFVSQMVALGPGGGRLSDQIRRGRLMDVFECFHLRFRHEIGICPENVFSTTMLVGLPNLDNRSDHTIANMRFLKCDSGWNLLLQYIAENIE